MQNLANKNLTNNEIIELLINLSERFDSRNVNELINELEVGDEFMRTS